MRRIPELDALRGLAAVAIVVYHLWFIQVVLLGTAVDLFFVLSGFLITTIILKHHGLKNFMTTFYIRRGLRIWPIYYLTLFVLVALNPFLPNARPLDGLPYYLTYTQKIQYYWFGQEPAFPEAFRHTWTLAIEEQFYLVWPALVLLAGRRRLPLLAVGVIAVSVSTRAAGFSPWILLTRCDGFALGGVLAALLLDPDRLQRRVGSIRLGLGLAGLSAVVAMVGFKVVAARPEWHHVAPLADSLKMLAVNVVYASLVGLVVCSAGRPALGWLRDRRLAYVGQISYGLYLYHHVILFIMGFGGEGRPWWVGWLVLAVTFGVAALSWRFVERPVLALKERFAYRGGPVGAAPIPAEPTLAGLPEPSL